MMGERHGRTTTLKVAQNAELHDGGDTGWVLRELLEDEGLTGSGHPPQWIGDRRHGGESVDVNERCPSLRSS